MPLKVECNWNENDSFDGEPIYDEKAMQKYCEENHVNREKLSEQEKYQFIV